MTTGPEITDWTETVIQFDDTGPDGLGRRRFTAYWLSDSTGPHCDQIGVRGQCFFTDPSVVAERARRRGRVVRFMAGGAS